MFKLFPFTLVLLMILKKVNYFNEEDEGFFNHMPQEYIKTNMFDQQNQKLKLIIEESLKNDRKIMENFGGILTDKFEEELGNIDVNYLVVVKTEESEKF